jgi:hypothetical protein
MWCLALQRAGQHQVCALMQTELEGLHRARAGVSGAEWCDVRGKLAEWGRGRGNWKRQRRWDGANAHRDQDWAEAMEQDQAAAAAAGSTIPTGGAGTSASVAGVRHRGGGCNKQADLACQWLYRGSGGRPWLLGHSGPDAEGRRLKGAWVE